MAQRSPLTNNTPAAECRQDLAYTAGTYSGESPRTVEARTAPSWAVGFGIQLLLAGAALVGAWAKTRTPARRLSKGSRIA